MLNTHAGAGAVPPPLPRDVDLTLLAYLVALVEERKVTRAAQRMGLSQAAMSHALARLRVLFNDQLLVRGRGQMIPTPRAMALAAGARKVLFDVGRLLEPAAPFDPAVTATTFVLTASEYAEYLIAPRLIARLQHEAPNVDIEIRRPNRELSARWLETGEIDLGIGWPQDRAPDLRAKLLFKDRYVCIARRDHPSVQGSVAVEQFLELTHVRSLLGQISVSARSIDSAVSGMRRKLRLGLVLQNYLTVPYTVAASDMVATVPSRLAADFAGPLGLQVIEPPLKLPQLQNFIYWHEHKHREPRHQWFRSRLAEIAETFGAPPAGP